MIKDKIDSQTDRNASKENKLGVHSLARGLEERDTEDIFSRQITSTASKT